MMSNNKILTVSYGTFSCTLEGFDDSFGTMKAIAEYFRDLAADDRYFGAEPPQPDAEMLARIAEREISRRVQAREHEGKIVLSAAQADAAPVQAEAPAAQTPSSDTRMIAQDVAEPAQPATADASDAKIADAMQPFADDATAQPEVAVAEGDAIPTHEEDAAEAIAEDQTADAAAVDLLAADADDGDTRETQDATSEEADAAEAFFARSEDADADADETPAAELISDEEDADRDDMAAEADEADDAVDEVDDAVAEEHEEDAPVAEPVAAPVSAPDSIAAKLQRIRAVVSQSQQEAEAEDLFEDEHADDFKGTQGMAQAMDLAAEDEAEDEGETVAEAARAIEEAQAADDAAAFADADADTEEESDVAAMLARFDDSTAQDADAVAESDTQDEGTRDDLGLDTLAALMAADDGQIDAEDEGDNIFNAEGGDDAEEAEAPRRARILKVKRAEIDAALASGDIEEIVDDADADEDIYAYADDDEDFDDDVETDDGDASTLSEQEEAELMAELAAVEAELPETAKEADAPAKATDATPAKVEDDDVSRLMAEADNQMEEPEGTRRRSAFAHLKAAVMAKKADAAIGQDTIESDVPFRTDLASAVKPRRPEASGARAERPEGARPAPLKLVAEQRVDIDTSPKGPVRPRRVAAIESGPADTGADGSFADFAADMGAHALPDLLEAAASYLSFVEGRDQFSRPQLMNKVRQVEKDDFSREDGLRSFGQLLRAGKIEKMKGGRFTVTDDIGYRPDHRAAG